MENKNLALHEPVVREGGPAPSNATAEPAAALTPEQVEWVVNDNAELGVKIGDQFFWLYKGYSLVYRDGMHDDGSPMHWRPVFKREFGECCHPINYADPRIIGTVSLDDSDDWQELPGLAAPVSAPGLSLAARLMSIASDDDVRLAVAGELSDREIPCYPKYLDDVFGTYLDHPAMRKALSTGQEITSPADGSQVEPSTTGTGRHIPLEPPPFIQWNGGENPAPGKVVEVKLRNGNVFLSLADHLRWDCIDRPGDIIAYRIQFIYRA